MSDDLAFTSHYLDELASLLPRLDRPKIAQAIGWMRAVRDAGKMIYICGNGGSASIASQMVVDIVKGASFKKKARFKMLGLTDSIATITAYANDEGYETVFVEQLKNYAEKDDLLIGISGSGNSPNVLRAIEYANSVGCKTIGVTTGEGGKLKDLVNLPLLVPSRHMGRLEDCFFILTHVLCYAFMEAD
ncbi:MAG: SIS domain-containing protein [Planctomycetaceae bacterium]